jgi:hypothetical protein
MKPTVKPPGSNRLKLKHHKLLSNFAFKSNLRHHNPVLQERWAAIKLDNKVGRCGFNP